MQQVRNQVIQQMHNEYQCGQQSEGSLLQQNEHQNIEEYQHQGSQITAQQQSVNQQDNIDRYGYALVMDNVDKNVRPSNQQIDRTTKSYHFTHSYAVQNRIDISQLSDKPSGAALSADVTLPNTQDVKILKEEFEILISRYNVLWLYYEVLISM